MDSAVIISCTRIVNYRQITITFACGLFAPTYATIMISGSCLSHTSELRFHNFP